MVLWDIFAAIVSWNISGQSIEKLPIVKVYKTKLFLNIYPEVNSCPTLSTKGKEYVVYSSNLQIILRSIFFPSFPYNLLNTDLNYLSIKVLSLYCVLGEIN
jgi:hypothetical protein